MKEKVKEKVDLVQPLEIKPNIMDYPIYKIDGVKIIIMGLILLIMITLLFMYVISLV